ncbi:unnamed protein product [Caenorhabditis brenneri]
MPVDWRTHHLGELNDESHITISGWNGETPGTNSLRQSGRDSQRILRQGTFFNATKGRYEKVGVLQLSHLSARTYKFGPPKRLVSVEDYCKSKDSISLVHPTDRCVYFLGAVGEHMAVETLLHVGDQAPAPPSAGAPPPASVAVPAAPPPPAPETRRVIPTPTWTKGLKKVKAQQTNQLDALKAVAMTLGDHVESRRR